MRLKSQLLTFRTRAPISSASNIDCLNKQNSFFVIAKMIIEDIGLLVSYMYLKSVKAERQKSSDCAIYVKYCYIIPNLLE